MSERWKRSQRCPFLAPAIGSGRRPDAHRDLLILHPLCGQARAWYFLHALAHDRRVGAAGTDGDRVVRVADPRSAWLRLEPVAATALTTLRVRFREVRRERFHFSPFPLSA